MYIARPFQLAFLAAIFLAVSLFADARPAFTQTTTAPQTVKVATRIVSPFVFKDKDELTGFSIELWAALSRELNVKFEIVQKNTLADLFEEVKSGKADLAIAAISITAERERIFDFSQPMFDAGLQIMVPTDRTQSSSALPALWSLISSRNFHELLLLLLILIFVPLPLIWLVERKDRHGLVMARSAIGEAFKSIWWSASTLAGQATNMPHTVLGRFIATVWMFVGVVFISYFTATVTANLTVKQLETGISGPQDLIGKKVATVKGSTASAYLVQQSIDTVEVNQISEAYEILKAGKAAAVVYDAPILLYYASKEGKGKVQMAGPVFRPEAYGILFPEGSAMRKNVNEALLKLRESGEYRAIYQRWFSADAAGG